MYRYRKYWIPAYFRDFPLGSMIRTTSVSESENSFYKNFLKPRLNLAEFYLSFNNALETQRHSSAKLDYADSTMVPILATEQPFEKHASTLFTDSVFRRVQEEIVEACNRCRFVGLSSQGSIDFYKIGDRKRNTFVVTHDKNDESYSCECKLFGRQGFLCCHIFYLFKNNEVRVIPDKYAESRWMKTPLVKAVHGCMGDSLENTRVIDEKMILTAEVTSLFYSCLARYQSNIETFRAFVGGVKELSSLDSDTPPISAPEKRRMVEEFYGMVRPEVVEVHPPDVVKTKGSCSTKLSVSFRRERRL